MKMREWDNWFKDWLARHPVKTPPEFEQQRFREHVMARIRKEVEQAPAGRLFGWLFWLTRKPLPAVALGSVVTTALAALVVTTLLPGSRTSVTGPEIRAPAPAGEGRIVLAQADEEEILSLWEELEEAEDLPDLNGLDEAEALLEALERLDEADLALS